MKSFKLFLMSAAVVLFAAGACTKEETTTEEGGTPEIEVGSEVASGTVTVSAVTTTLSIDVSVANATSSGSLTVSVSADWLSAEVGSDVVTLTMSANDTGEDRSATVTLSYSEAEDVSFTVTQVVPVITVYSEQVSVSYEAGTTTVRYSVTNALDGEEVTVYTDGSGVVTATVDSDNSVVTLTVNENTDYSTKSEVVTLSYPYAKDVEFTVVQQALPYPATYSDYLGTWTVTDEYGTSTTFQISERINGVSYNVSGWQFGYGDTPDLTDLGFDSSGSTDFTATYDSTNDVLVFSTVNFGTNTYYYEEADVTLSGTVWLLGTVISNGAETIVTPSSSSGSYDIATMTMTSPENAEMTGGNLLLSDYNYYDVISMQYILSITSPNVYSGYYMYWESEGAYLPSTLTKTDAASASVKSSSKSVPFVNGGKAVKAL